MVSSLVEAMAFSRFARVDSSSRMCRSSSRLIISLSADVVILVFQRFSGGESSLTRSIISPKILTCLNIVRRMSKNSNRAAAVWTLFCRVSVVFNSSSSDFLRPLIKSR